MYHDELMRGGKLSFELGAEPNTKWGVETVPPSMSNENK
jgi:putative alpha-1,2-mannosidase